MRILVSGLCGHMGKEVEKVILKGCRGAELAGGVDAFADGSSSVPCVTSFEDVTADFDVIVDFSHHSVTSSLTDFAKKRNVPLVIATTGQTEAEREIIREASLSVPVFFAANYSLGIALLIELAKKTAAVMGDAEIEIVEAHHDRKLDAPSGTALAIAEAIKEVRPASNLVCGREGRQVRKPEDIGIHSIRMGNIVGMHEVMVGTDNQTITLKHEAHSRAIFAEGAIAAAAFITGKAPGLYTMNDLLGEEI